MNPKGSDKGKQGVLKKLHILAPEEVEALTDKYLSISLCAIVFKIPRGPWKGDRALRNHSLAQMETGMVTC
jgi:hypothetical protein